ncbi:unnamed protein product [Acanthoscelides obtectus]|uniref:Uncharacterized protein n=1 Tax=Acanthoscelides obtectus TaxID=200917 RepID=A0A9P0K2F6_ACAOB|nr:unnamed protein product [Acanthoscelides obtectus]CAK1629087.1 hypothetical protein AOBTE_LOCUS5569 [Acanthoscelides obtectus]
MDSDDDSGADYFSARSISIESSVEDNFETAESSTVTCQEEANEYVDSVFRASVVRSLHLTPDPTGDNSNIACAYIHERPREFGDTSGTGDDGFVKVVDESLQPTSMGSAEASNQENTRCSNSYLCNPFRWLGRHWLEIYDYGNLLFNIITCLLGFYVLLKMIDIAARYAKKRLLMFYGTWPPP